ncbi:MAG: tetratricopeptide repeat protein, partial [Chloroflexota bacterium]
YAKAYNNKAWVLHLQGQYQQALIIVSKSLDLEPRSAAALHTRGAVHLALGHINSSILDFEEALKIEPDFQEAIEDLAKARAKLKS